MTDITVSLDDQIVDKARRVASHRCATLDGLVRNFVERLAAQDDASRATAAADLERSFRQLSRPMGGVDWNSREELHER